MKAILFFAAFGRPSETDIENANIIQEKTNERVVFRNGSLAAQTSEAPEPALGYAGLVPKTEAYQTKPIYSVNDDGEMVTTKPGDGVEKLAVVGGSVGGTADELNEIGLPLGSPDNRDDLKKALDEAEIEYHKSAQTKTLVEVYKSEILAEDSE